MDRNADSLFLGPNGIAPLSEPEPARQSTLMYTGLYVTLLGGQGWHTL
jgi:hypothetical protein